jgi:hypothetical protein
MQHPLISRRRHAGTRIIVIERVDAGRLHRGVVFQDQFWWDKNGRGHALSGMRSSHLRNVESFLRSRAMQFADWEASLECEHCRRLFAGHVLPDCEDDEFDEWEWIVATPLHIAVCEEMRRRGLTAYRCIIPL